MANDDRVFAGNIPRLYDELMVPLIFEPYARDMASRLSGLPLRRVLEVAAGSGAVTRELATTLDDGVEIVATDLNQAMIDHASARGTARPVTWKQADASALPFADGEFDAVVCQFGAMFFPDKPHAYSEARRVLRRGGVFLFSVWDRIEENEFADVVTASVGTIFPNDPPRFLARTPHGYHDVDTVAGHLASAGFSSAPMIDTVAERSRAVTARDPAIAYCQGTPLRNEIEARGGAARLGAVTDEAAHALAKRFGSGPVDGKIQAHVVMVAA